MTETISFGAGINSVAMTIMLVDRGWTGPIVFADTGAEHPETYCYLDYFQKQYLTPRNLSVTRLQPGSPYHSKKAQLPLEQYCLNRGIIPLLAVRWCSVEWKRDPLKRWSTPAISLLGISASEPRRIRDDPTVRYPLYEEGITRNECRRIIQRARLAVPIKSGCFFCPGQNLGNIKRLFFDHPDLYERACLMEDNASQHNQKHATLDPHQISYREHARRRWQGQLEMDFSHSLPCLCAL